MVEIKQKYKVSFYKKTIMSFQCKICPFKTYAVKFPSQILACSSILDNTFFPKKIKCLHHLAGQANPRSHLLRWMFVRARKIFFRV